MDPNWHDLAGDQKRAAEWVSSRFGPEIQSFIPERVDRSLEETVELHQAEHASSPQMLEQGREQAHRIVELVYNKPPGDPAQEVAGVMVTLLAYAEAKGYRLDQRAKEELCRIETLPAEHFHSRQMRKAAEGMALAPTTIPMKGGKLPPGYSY